MKKNEKEEAKRRKNRKKNEKDVKRYEEVGKMVKSWKNDRKMEVGIKIACVIGRQRISTVAQRCDD